METISSWRALSPILDKFLSRVLACGHSVDCKMEALANSSNLPDVSLHLSMLTFNPRDPPPPPTTTFYYSTVVAKNVSSIYRVVESNGQFQCYPEAQGWPQLVLSSQGELQNSFTLLEDDQIFCSKPDFERDPGQVRFPDLEELRLHWQVGSTVYFRHCDVRIPGIVVGKFVWHMLGDRNAGPSRVDKTLRLVLLLQLPTNELLLSSQVRIPSVNTRTSCNSKCSLTWWWAPVLVSLAKNLMILSLCECWRENLTKYNQFWRMHSKYLYSRQVPSIHWNLKQQLVTCIECSRVEQRSSKKTLGIFFQSD